MIMFCLVLMLLTLTPQTEGCMATPRRDHPYVYNLYIDFNFNTCEDSESSCSRHNSHLASVHSKEDEDFLKTLSVFSQLEKNNETAIEEQRLFLGLVKDKASDVWRWRDGSPLDYNKVDRGISLLRDECYCAVLSSGKSDTWGVEKCDTSPTEKTGGSCAAYKDFCKYSPCLRGGTCQVTEDVGYDCDVENIPDDVNFCYTGSGTFSIGTFTLGEPLYTCDCPPGTKGETCEQDVNCTAVPCANDGTCLDHEDGRFSCLCHSNYTGLTCESIVSVEPGINGTTVSNFHLFPYVVIAGGCALLLLIIVIVTVIICICRKKKQSSKSGDLPTSQDYELPSRNNSQSVEHTYLGLEDRQSPSSTPAYLAFTETKPGRDRCIYANVPTDDIYEEIEPESADHMDSIAGGASSGAKEAVAAQPTVPESPLSEEYYTNTFQGLYTNVHMLPSAPAPPQHVPGT